MEKDDLPRYSTSDEYAALRQRRQWRRRILRLAILVAFGFALFHWSSDINKAKSTTDQELLSKERLVADYATCSKLRHKPQDPIGPREANARWQQSQKPVLIRNATVWTGEAVASSSSRDESAGESYSWIHADVYLEKGIIRRVEPGIAPSSLAADHETWDANGRLLTAGIVDMHSHAGVDTLPELVGSSDDNELSSDTTPYVRSLDAFNPLDHQLEVIKSGGVTTSLILPGSGNNIGGEAYVIKHAVGPSNGRPEISAEDMLADPDQNWRYMKCACGENAKRVYGEVGRDYGPFSRMGEAYYFRHAFEQASHLVQAQDDWCNAADRLGAENMPDYLPAPLEWETLAAALRGQVMVNTHCYTIPDLEAFVRHTNEFNFSVRAFHHAHQTYLVPEILKRAYGDRPPAAALFADNMYYKAEAYIGSEQAGKILYENGITPVYVSDNPVLNAQHVLFEAAKAFKNGLPYHVALAGVTSASAELLGMGERIGKVKPGFDADVVVWDSDPLSVGAAPVQVWIDGTPQFEKPVELRKPDAGPIEGQIHYNDTLEAITTTRDIVLRGVSFVVLPELRRQLSSKTQETDSVLIRNSQIICAGNCEDEIAASDSNPLTIHLQNGHIRTPLTAVGNFLGLVEIAAEDDTQDGSNGDSTFSAALDGLSMQGKSLAAAYSHGVTRAISAPASSGDGRKGVSVGFRTGAKHSLEEGAVWEDEVAVHYTLTLGAKTEKTPSLSSAVDGLRRKLLKAVKAGEKDEGDLSLEDARLKQVVKGEMPLVLDVHSADTIASLLRMKIDIESAMRRESDSDDSALRLVLFGAAESHLLAEELAAANVSVILAPLLPYSETWEQRRSLTGAPLTNGTTVDVLHAAGVQVAISTKEDWETRDLALMAGIAHANSDGEISEDEAWSMVSSNIYAMLGLDSHALSSSGVGGDTEFVVYDGNPLEIDSRVRVVADGRGEVTVWT
ncbi:amidohydrolase [Hortaea werneckii]|nr:amidohydrolase [Hortaea werneckii]